MKNHKIQKIESFFISLKKKILQKINNKWTTLGEESKKEILDIMSYFANTAIMSFFISFVIIILINYDLNFKNYITVFFCVIVLIPFIEHYYVWFKDGWRVKT